MVLKLPAYSCVILRDFFLHTDPPCQVNNNCGENSFCYIYPETGEKYCAQSCLLNNGGCGDQQCTMLQVICFRAPCPPIVQCEPLSKLYAFVHTCTYSMCKLLSGSSKCMCTCVRVCVCGCMHVCVGCVHVHARVCAVRGNSRKTADWCPGQL